MHSKLKIKYQWLCPKSTLDPESWRAVIQGSFHGIRRQGFKLLLIRNYESSVMMRWKAVTFDSCIVRLRLQRLARLASYQQVMHDNHLGAFGTTIRHKLPSTWGEVRSLSLLAQLNIWTIHSSGFKGSAREASPSRPRLHSPTPSETSCPASVWTWKSVTEGQYSKLQQSTRTPTQILLLR